MLVERHLTIHGTCPECLRGTLDRIGGEWCPSCRGWVVDVHVNRGESGEALRILRAPR